MTKVAFIGLGIMGSHMAAHIQQAGHLFAVYNRSKEKAKPFTDKGATYFDTPAEAAKEAEVVITMVSTPEAVTEVSVGEKGLLKTLKKGSIWVNTSTINPSFAEKLAKAAQEKGIRYLDAPVAGSKIPAQKAELNFLIGGEQADLESVKNILSLMGKNITHFGTYGKGSAMKLAINAMLAQALLAFSESVSFAESLGLPKDKVMQVLSSGIVGAPVLGMKKDKMQAGDYEPEFPLQWMHKDLHLTAITAFEQQHPMPLLNAAKEVYAVAEKMGWGNKDFAAVYNVYEDKKADKKSLENKKEFSN